VGIGTTSPAKKLDVSGAIRASTGILFGSDTAADNTLDDYEEGTWTPDVIAAGGGLTISYSSRHGRYTKIGRVVYCEFDLTISSESGGSGNVQITGLPFTKSSGAPSFAGDLSMIRGGRTTALGAASATKVAYAFAGTVYAGQTELELSYTDIADGSAAAYTVSDLGTGRIVGSFQYVV
jgi:hypothetical protein